MGAAAGGEGPRRALGLVQSRTRLGLAGRADVARMGAAERRAARRQPPGACWLRGELGSWAEEASSFAGGRDAAERYRSRGQVYWCAGDLSGLVKVQGCGLWCQANTIETLLLAPSSSTLRFMNHVFIPDPSFLRL
jgi:hypothetical protein